MRHCSYCPNTRSALYDSTGTQSRVAAAVQVQVQVVVQVDAVECTQQRRRCCSAPCWCRSTAQRLVTGEERRFGEASREYVWLSDRPRSQAVRSDRRQPRSVYVFSLYLA